MIKPPRIPKKGEPKWYAIGFKQPNGRIQFWSFPKGARPTRACAGTYHDGVAWARRYDTLGGAKRALTGLHDRTEWNRQCTAIITDHRGRTLYRVEPLSPTTKGGEQC